MLSSGSFAGGGMARIVVSLLKGGVAKSQTAVSLAHGLSLAGYKVLLVDTDVQAQCSDMLGVSPGKGLAQVVSGLCRPLDALFEARENLWLLAGGTELAGVKMEIARREMAPEQVLSDTMEHYAGGFDVMIMDTAPGWDTLLVNALYCCRDVLSPVSMEPMALNGLIRFQERLSIIQKYNPQLKLRWIVPTFVDGRVKKTGEIMGQLQERFGPLLTGPIKYSVKLSEGTAFGKTIFEHDPKGVGAAGYQALVDLVVSQCLADGPTAPRQTQAPAGDLGERSVAKVLNLRDKMPEAETGPAGEKAGPQAPEPSDEAPVAKPEPEPAAPEPAAERKDSPAGGGQYGIPLPRLSLRQRLEVDERPPELKPAPAAPPAARMDEAIKLELCRRGPGLKARLKNLISSGEVSEEAVLRKIRERFKDGRA